jgi:hypothetical protein
MIELTSTLNELSKPKARSITVCSGVRFEKRTKVQKKGNKGETRKGRGKAQERACTWRRKPPNPCRAKPGEEEATRRKGGSKDGL